YRQQAEGLLELLKEKGFTDAFVVNVNDERKYSNAVVSFNNNNIRSQIVGKVEFAVQLGAFKEDIPEELSKAYLTVDGLVEVKQGDLTLITSSSYSSYEEAEENKLE